MNIFIVGMAKWGVFDTYIMYTCLLNKIERERKEDLMKNNWRQMIVCNPDLLVSECGTCGTWALMNTIK